MKSTHLTALTTFLACLVIMLASDVTAQSVRSRPGGKRRVPASHQKSSARPSTAVQYASEASDGHYGGSVVEHDDYEVRLAPSAVGHQVHSSVSHPELVVDSMAHGCDSCGTANVCCCSPFGFLLDWTRADLWLGVTGFTGPGNFSTTGSSSNGQAGGAFGFQEGFNFGSRLPSLLGGQIGSQLGMRFTHTQMDGTVAGDDHRTQTFLTAGLFRRVDYGLQGGLVVDYLHDDWIYQADLLQLRGELSFLFSPCHDLGFRFSDAQQIDDTVASVSGVATPVALRITSLNTYRFFYRYRYGDMGKGLAELQLGFTEDSGTLLGLNLKTPLQNQLGLETSAIYATAPSDAMVPYTEEGWNVSMAVVWTPGRIFGSARDYYRPLFNVADNGSMIARLLP